jgi:hypothetical protein
MKRWQWVLLIFELVLVAAILVLPQVDLPELAFHCGTAPVAAKARVSSAPVQVIEAPLSLHTFSFQMLQVMPERETRPPSSHTDSRLSVLCVRLC